MRNRKQWVALIAVIAVAGLVGGAVAATMGQDAAMQKLTEARTSLVEAKAGLGMYSCCIDPSCNFCALASGMCPCGDNATTEKGVCGECWLGWKAGQGSLDGVAPDDVQHIHGDMLQMMYRMRAESVPGDDE